MSCYNSGVGGAVQHRCGFFLVIMVMLGVRAEDEALQG